MKERPILFSAPMVRALLAGTKTQTRRIVKLEPWMAKANMTLVTAKVDSGFYGEGAQYLKVSGEEETWHRLCAPYGQPGDRLWVRETFCLETCRHIGWYEPPHQDGRPIKHEESETDGRYWHQPHYRATDHEPDLFYEDGPPDPHCRWSPSIHMPRWASRITLEITGVRVERLNEISVRDAEAEGIEWTKIGMTPGTDIDIDGQLWPPGERKIVGAYRDLWESINGPGSWELSPWVWVISFRRVSP